MELGIGNTEAVLLRTVRRFDIDEPYENITLFPCIRTATCHTTGQKVQTGIVFQLFYTSYPLPRRKGNEQRRYRRMPLGHGECWNIENCMYEDSETRQSVVASLEAAHAAPGCYLSTDFSDNAPESKLTGCSLGLSVMACVLGLPRFAYTGWITPYSIDPSDLIIGSVRGIGAKMKFCRENNIVFFLSSSALESFKAQAKEMPSDISAADMMVLEKSSNNRYYNIDQYLKGARFDMNIFEAVEINSFPEAVILSLAIASQQAIEKMHAQ